MLEALRDAPTGTDGYWVFYRDGSVSCFYETELLPFLNNQGGLILDSILSILKGKKVRMVTETKRIVKCFE